MALCVLESLAPQGTPVQRFYDSARPTMTLRSSSRPANRTRANESPITCRRSRRPIRRWSSTRRIRSSPATLTWSSWRCRTVTARSLVPQLVQRHVSVVDLGADFRLKDKEAYHQWYGDAHVAPDLLATAVYGLVERHRKELVGATLIAVPGCYPTASILALGPFLDAELIERPASSSTPSAELRAPVER